MIDVRKYFPKLLSNSVTYNDPVPLLVHVHFGPDKQKPYENNFGVLNYEVINSPFILFKFYLDVRGRIFLNQCTKYLLPRVFENENVNECRNSKLCVHRNCFVMKKCRITHNIFVFAVKFIKHLVSISCQSVNPFPIKNCYDVYTLGKHYQC